MVNSVVGKKIQSILYSNKVYYLIILSGIFTMLHVGAVAAGDSLTITKKVELVYPAFETVGINIIYDGDDNSNASMTMKYRLHGKSAWQEGHPGVWVESYPNGRPPMRKEMATRLFGLKSDSTYDVEVQFTDQDGITGTGIRKFSVTTRAEPKIVNKSGDTWHVRSDIAPGKSGKSNSRAFATIADAIAVADAGDTILLYGGEHIVANRINLSKSGTVNKPIIIKAAAGCKPIVRGPLSGLEKPGKVTWKKYKDGIYYTTLTNKPGQVYCKTDYLGECDSLENLTNGKRKHGKRLFDIGLQGGWFHANQKLYVKYCKIWGKWDGATENPQSVGIQPVAQLHGSIYTPGLYVNGNYIVFDGISFQHFCLAILVKYHGVGREADNVTIRNCDFKYNRLSISLSHSVSAMAFSGVNNALVDNCTFSCSPSYWYRDWTLGHDLFTADHISATALRGSCGVVRDCSFSDAENGVYVGDWGSSPKSDPGITPGWVVKDCDFLRLGDDGVEFEGSGYQCVALRNNLNQVLTGISCAPCSVGPVWAIRNTIYQADRLNPLGTLDNRSDRFPNGPFKFNVAVAPGGPLGKATLLISYHNSAYVNTTLSSAAASSRLFQPTPGLRWHSRNDSFVRATKGGKSFMVIPTVLEGRIYGQGEEDILDIDFDYDNFWTADKKFASDRAGTYATFQEWKSAGYNPHGCSIAVPYVKPSDSNFKVPSGTALHDGGLLIPGINDDYLGRAPDIGSYEMPGRNVGAIPHELKIKNGSGAGSYTAGTVVLIKARVPPARYMFDKWVGNVSGIDNVKSANAKLTMPGTAVSLKATYRIFVKAAWIKIDDFSSYPKGKMVGKGLGKWESVGARSGKVNLISIASDPTKKKNKTLKYGDGKWKHPAFYAWNNDPRLRINDNTTRTLFFRFYCAGDDNHWGCFGMSELATSTGKKEDLATALTLAPLYPGVALKYLDGWLVPTVEKEIAKDEWYDVWMVIDSIANTCDGYIKGGTWKTQTKIVDGAKFYRGEAGKDVLSTFMINRMHNQSGPTYFDDLYIINGKNLTSPKK